METKQTAVEWLQLQLKKGIDYNPLEKNGYSNAEQKLFEQAKQMETEQIKQAHNTGFVDAYDWPHKRNAEQYYNETYGN